MQRFLDDRSALSIRGGRCFVINIMFPTDQTSHFYRHLRCCCCDCDCSSSFHPRCAALVHRHIVFAVLWRSTDETTLNDVVGANRERETAATIEPQAHESVPIYTKPLPNSLKLGISIANNNVPFCHPKPNNGIHDQHCSGLWSGIWIPVWCGAYTKVFIGTRTRDKTRWTAYVRASDAFRVEQKRNSWILKTLLWLAFVESAFDGQV